MTDFLENRLFLPERTRFELHLCRCTWCRIYLGQMRAVVQASGRLAEEDLSMTTRETLVATFREWRRGRIDA